MSKNITHKEHRQLLSGLYKKQGGKWIYQADAYIKQQEKQEKLLVLYKEQVKQMNILFEESQYVHSINGVDENERWSDAYEALSDINIKIKELENE